MGFLDHSTNNIIVDAVLTDAGRRALARNDGSFQIFQFALGDDEVDYNLIKQYGRTVGKEKIEKNTPIMEALTAGNLALKNRLVSVSNEFLSYLPILSINATNNNNLVFNRTTTTNKQVVIEVAPAAGTGVDVEDSLIDKIFRVELNQLFFKISNEEPDVTYTDNTVVYEIPADNGSGEIVSTSTINLQVNTNLTDTAFDIYSVAGGSYIKTFIKVTGLSSGITKTIELRINKENA